MTYDENVLGDRGRQMGTEGRQITAGGDRGRQNGTEGRQIWIMGDIGRQNGTEQGRQIEAYGQQRATK